MSHSQDSVEVKEEVEESGKIGEGAVGDGRPVDREFYHDDEAVADVDNDYVQDGEEGDDQDDGDYGDDQDEEDEDYDIKPDLMAKKSKRRQRSFSGDDDYDVVKRKRKRPNKKTKTVHYTVKCIFCSKLMTDSALQYHAMSCTEIQKMEDTRPCPFCQRSLPESKSYQHEVICKDNPDRTKSTKLLENEDNSVKCGKCNDVVATYDRLRLHLAKCLPKLAELRKQSEDWSRDNAEEVQRLAAELEDSKSSELTQGPISANTHLTCVYCCKVFRYQIMKDHGINCESLRKIQPKRKCSFCDTKPMPESKSYLHEVLCDQNPNQIKSTRDTTAELRCPKCEALIKNYSQFRHHLATKCLDLLKSLVDKCVEKYRSSPHEQTEVLKFEKKHQMFVKVNPDSTIPCPFCQKPFKSLDGLKDHPLACPSMKVFEPKQACQHCNISLPFSLWSLHEFICHNSRTRIPMTTDNLRYADVCCPSCGSIYKAKHLPRHLSHCLPGLQTLMASALEDKSPDWQERPREDYFSKAGVYDWIKPRS